MNADDQKGRLELGDVVHVCADDPQVAKLFNDLEGATVVGVSDPLVTLKVPADQGYWVIDVARKYFCSGATGHIGQPCVFCGY